MNALNVELYGTVLGTLTQKKGRLLEFEVCPDVFEKYQLSSTVMSLAVPLNLHYTIKQKKRAENYFAEFLPEGRNLEWLMQSIPKGERTLFGTLKKYGRDIAGALSIYDSDDTNCATRPEACRVDGKQIRHLLEHMPQAALGNAPVSGRTSLGGVQGKILLAKIGADWYRVHNGYPSTHILKPVVLEYPTMIYDEAFCMQMAFNCGLTAHPVRIETFNGADALIIERYDRTMKNMTEQHYEKQNFGDTCYDIIYDRVHQEDFNQVLGAYGSEKYQEYSGKVSAKRIAQTLMQFGKETDVTKFASQLIFAIAIGNLDMHAKNVSILHYPDETIELAPTYDQVPLRHQNTDDKLALAINGIYEHKRVTMTDIAAEIFSWQSTAFSHMDEAMDFTYNCLKTYKEALYKTTHPAKSHPRLPEDISSFITNLLSGKITGGNSRH